MVYQATVENNDETTKYIGITGGTFKQRYNNHKKHSKTKKYKKETQLSKYICNLKKNNIQYKIKCEILQKSNTHIRRSQICNLCLEEK